MRTVISSFSLDSSAFCEEDWLTAVNDAEAEIVCWMLDLCSADPSLSPERPVSETALENVLEIVGAGVRAGAGVSAGDEGEATVAAGFAAGAGAAAGVGVGAGCALAGDAAGLERRDTDGLGTDGSLLLGSPVSFGGSPGTFAAFAPAMEDGPVSLLSVERREAADADAFGGSATGAVASGSSFTSGSATPTASASTAAFSASAVGSRIGSSACSSTPSLP